MRAWSCKRKHTACVITIVQEIRRNVCVSENVPRRSLGPEKPFFIIRQLIFNSLASYAIFNLNFGNRLHRTEKCVSPIASFITASQRLNQQKLYYDYVTVDWEFSNDTNRKSVHLGLMTSISQLKCDFSFMVREWTLITSSLFYVYLAVFKVNTSILGQCYCRCINTVDVLLLEGSPSVTVH